MPADLTLAELREWHRAELARWERIVRNESTHDVRSPELRAEYAGRVRMHSGALALLPDGAAVDAPTHDPVQLARKIIVAMGRRVEPSSEPGADYMVDRIAALIDAAGVPAQGPPPQRGDWRTWDVRGAHGVEGRKP